MTNQKRKRVWIQLSLFEEEKEPKKNNLSDVIFVAPPPSKNKHKNSYIPYSTKQPNESPYQKYIDTLLIHKQHLLTLKNILNK